MAWLSRDFVIVFSLWEFGDFFFDHLITTYCYVLRVKLAAVYELRGCYEISSPC